MKLCGFEAALDAPLFLIAGPCVVESEALQVDVAGQLREMCGALAIPFSRRSVTAASRSPFVSSSARLQSIIPAPVFSRSSLTRVAEIAALNSPPPWLVLIGPPQPALIRP